MAILNNSNAISSGGYDINNSLRFRASASAYLNRTPASAGNRKTWTWSSWIKRGQLLTTEDYDFFAAGSTDGAVLRFSGGASNAIRLVDYNGSSFFMNLITSQSFRDPSAWYHIVVAVDSTQATTANRVKLYVNGNQVTAFSTAVYPSLNQDCTHFNNNGIHNIGRNPFNAGQYFDGYMTDINFIDGSQKAASDFGETDTTTGVWKPKAYTGTYGTNGFYLKFSDIATTSGSNAGLGKDFSGNANYWTTNNISVTAGTTYDAMTDSPTLTSATVANYCVLNPIDIIPSRTLPVISGGNLDASNGGSGDDLAHGTIAVSSGKWYFEMVAGTVPGATTHFVGWQVPVPSPVNGGLYRSSGVIYDFSATTTSAPTYTANDIIGCMVDVDAGKVWFSKNGTYVNSGDPAAGTNPAYTFTAGLLITPALAFDNIASTCTASVNFGQRPFSYTPPTGFVALNTYNLPDSTIVKGNSYMNALLYTGNGTNNRTVTGVGFNPSLTWVKSRSLANSHVLADSVRGTNANIYSNLTNAETAPASSGAGGIGQVTTDGFTLVQGTSNFDNTNTSSATYVAWNWLAGASTSSNTSGSTTSTVSVNTTAGFSVVTYTGTGANATVGHGLGVAPKMIIFKGRSTTFDWMVYHTSLGNTNYLRLNQTNASAASSSAFNNTSPTSTVFSLGDGSLGNNGSSTQVAYCWAEIAGFSKFTSYVGNGSADGPFVYLGFRPKYLMIKSSSNSSTEWLVWDSSRNQYNSTNSFLYPNLSEVEYTGSAANLDFLSNGFKLRNTNAGSASSNQSGYTYIVAAWAENPFKNALAR